VQERCAFFQILVAFRIFLALGRNRGMEIVKSRSSGRQVLVALALSALIATLALAATAQASTRDASSSARARALSAFRHDATLVALGQHRRADRGTHARAAVVGGALTSIEQVPWQVAVFVEFEFEEELFGLLCGGSIVRDMSHVLTAGHCAYNPITGARLPAEDFTVVAGVSSISEKEILEGPTSQARKVVAARAHPYFEYLDGPGTPDDVAELELAAPLEASTAVGTIALPSASTSPAAEGESAALSGFGEEDPSNEELNGNLYSLGETLGFSRQCGGEANAVFLCASSSNGSACSGDSGGALVGGSSPQQIGVVDTVAIVGGQRCSHGALNGFANVTAPEILDFVEGSEAPPRAPRGGGAGIRGFIEVGRSLTCEPGSWSGGATYTYAFVDSAVGQVLQRGPAALYPLTSADLGRAILCEVFATNAGGTGIGRTPALPPIEGARTGAGAGAPLGSGGGPGAPQPVAASAPPPGGAVLGSSAQSVSTARIAALLTKALAASGKLAKIASLTHSGGATVMFEAPRAGSVVIDWYLTTARASSARGGAAKPLLLAAGHKAFAKAGSARIAIVLTSAGKRALRGRKHATVSAKGTFTRAGASAVTVSKTIVLAR
jgi:hypothetical protein